MKKISNIYRAKSEKELLVSLQNAEAEIAKMQVEKSVKPNKDTNLQGKKRREVAIIKTFLAQLKLGVNK